MNTRPQLLLVDDEERILRSLAMLFRGSYQVRTTTDAREALRMLAETPAHVVVSDQRMPLMSGAALLREVRQQSPQTMRILLTGYAELDAVVASVNEGEIFRFVSKPWDATELRETVDEAARIAATLQRSAATEPDTATAEAVLVIDDDPAVFDSVREIIGEANPVFEARSLDEALGLIAREPIGVIVSELEVGREPLSGFLKTLKAEHPAIVSIVLAPLQDVSVFVGLINQGQVYRLLPKPVRRGPLSMCLASALRHHRALVATPMLREAHRVEKIRDGAELSVANRAMSLLSRLRRRPANG